MNKKIVYIALQQFCESDIRPQQALEEAGLEVRLNRLGRRLKADEMVNILQDADAVVAGVEPYKAELLGALPKLKCISRCGIGSDAIDLEAAKKRGIEIRLTIDEVTEPVAQMTLTMILALARNIGLHAYDFQSAQWRKHTGHLLSEWTVGLVGFGRIGRMVARYLQPLNCRLLVCDPYLKAADLPPDIEQVDLPSLLSKSDVVSLHAACSPKEGALMGSAQFAAMKPGSYLVNTSRGYLVNESALLKALESKHLAGAALDVFEEEPYVGPLAKLPQVLCTPHVATLTQASRSAMELRAALNVVEFFKRGLQG